MTDTHLEPQEVLEFKELFKDTVHIWVYGKEYQDLILRRDGYYSCQDMETETQYHMPAPNLQEVLMAIPEIINGPYTRMDFYTDFEQGMWEYGYTDGFGEVVYSGISRNPLEAAYDLLYKIKTYIKK